MAKKVLFTFFAFLLCNPCFSQNGYIKKISSVGDTSFTMFPRSNNLFTSQSGDVFVLSTSSLFNSNFNDPIRGPYINGATISRLDSNGVLMYNKTYKNNSLNGYSSLDALGRVPSRMFAVDQNYIYLPSSCYLGWSVTSNDSSFFGKKSRPFLLKIDVITGDTIDSKLLSGFNPYSSEVRILDISLLNDTLILVYQDLSQKSILIDKMDSGLNVLARDDLIIGEFVEFAEFGVDNSIIYTNSGINSTNLEYSKRFLNGNNSWFSNACGYIKRPDLRRVVVTKSGKLWTLVLDTVNSSISSTINSYDTHTGSLENSFSINAVFIDFDIKDSVILALEVGVENSDYRVLKFSTNGSELGAYDIVEPSFKANTLRFSNDFSWILAGSVIRVGFKDEICIMRKNLSQISSIDNKNFEFFRGILFYPNPLGGNRLLYFREQYDLLFFYSSRGRLLKTIESYSRTIDLSGFKSGVYFIKSQLDDKVLWFRLVVQ